MVAGCNEWSLLSSKESRRSSDNDTNVCWSKDSNLLRPKDKLCKLAKPWKALEATVWMLLSAKLNTCSLLYHVKQMPTILICYTYNCTT
jgi:hypothetical protein